jgi:hypothetical protein
LQAKSADGKTALQMCAGKEKVVEVLKALSGGC